MFGKLICWLTKHKRGVRVSSLEIDGIWVVHLQCPRCKTAWIRKAKKAQPIS